MESLNVYSGRYKNALFFQFVAHPQLSVGRLFVCEVQYALFNFRINAVLLVKFLFADFLQGGFPASLLQRLEPIEAVP
jgi:hypothetical protein